MTSGVDAPGVTLLADTLDVAADQLADLGADSGRDSGQLVQLAAHPPQKTGRLAAGVLIEVDGQDMVLSYTQVYAGVIHFGWPAHNIKAQPWLYTALDQAEPGIIDLYSERVGDILQGVKA